MRFLQQFFDLILCWSLMVTGGLCKPKDDKGKKNDNDENHGWDLENVFEWIDNYGNSPEEPTTSDNTDPPPDDQPKAIEKDLYFRWASQGAGARSIPFNAGFAYLFGQAGLIQENDSRFASMSYTSGGLLFGTALFWSEVFIQNTVFASTTQDLFDFMKILGKAYNQVWNPFTDIYERGRDSFWSQVYYEQEFSAGQLLDQVAKLTAQDIGEPDFVEKPANYDNRNHALRNTDLYLATSFHPNARYRDGFGKDFNSLTYLGPANSDNVFA